jgi:hypothetical protein
MRYYLRHIDREEQDLRATLGVEIKTKRVQRGYRLRLTDIAPEQLNMLPQFLSNETRLEQTAA